MSFFIAGITKPQEYIGYDLAIFTSLIKPVGHPQSHFIFEPWTLQFAIKKQTQTKQNKIKNMLPGWLWLYGTQSGFTEMPPVIVVSCYCPPVSQRRKPEQLNNTHIYWGKRADERYHAEKKSFLLNEVSTMRQMSASICPAKDPRRLERHSANVRGHMGLHFGTQSVTAFCFT